MWLAFKRFLAWLGAGLKVCVCEYVIIIMTEILGCTLWKKVLQAWCCVQVEGLLGALRCRVDHE